MKKTQFEGRLISSLTGGVTMVEDNTESIRRELVTIINSNPEAREELEKEHGKDNVWNTDEASEKFEFVGFMAPFVIVERKSDGKKGTLTFQHSPRFYFDFRLN